MNIIVITSDDNDIRLRGLLVMERRGINGDHIGMKTEEYQLYLIMNYLSMQ